MLHEAFLAIPVQVSMQAIWLFQDLFIEKDTTLPGISSHCRLFHCGEVEHTGFWSMLHEACLAIPVQVSVRALWLFHDLFIEKDKCVVG